MSRSLTCFIWKALWLLASHQEAQLRLRQELAPVFDQTSRPSYADLKDLPWLDGVVCAISYRISRRLIAKHFSYRQEALRLYPATPMSFRVSAKTDTIDGILVPSGTMLYMPVSVFSVVISLPTRNPACLYGPPMSCGRDTMVFWTIQSLAHHAYSHVPIKTCSREFTAPSAPSFTTMLFNSTLLPKLIFSLVLLSDPSTAAPPHSTHYVNYFQCRNDHLKRPDALNYTFTTSAR